MDTLPTNPRSRVYNVPKPEADLAEWTNKIKALQRQVDADDEAEQRRLEEEIVTARKARLRRSRGAEMETSLGRSRIEIETSNASRSEPKHAPVDRPTHPSDAPRRLMNQGHTAGSDAAKKTFSHRAIMQPKVPEGGVEPMSLAAFIGGRANGPRLNKHAPQQDATDPTQFEQRTLVTAPHPVFGRGGVAMPGLVGQRPSVTRAQENSGTGSRFQPSIVVSAAPLAPKERSVSPLKTGERENKENVVSQKATDKALTNGSQRGSDEGKNTVLQRANIGQQLVFPQVADADEQTVLHQRTGSRERTRSTPVESYAMKNASRPATKSPERKNPQHRIMSPPAPRSGIASDNHRYSSGSSNGSPSAQRLSSTPSYLARPIQPEPRPLSQSTIPPSLAPSPAFAKLSAPKEITPSISRLQGRGFVQNMVKISSQLESSAVAPPSPPTKPRAARKSSVLDRWQPAVAANSSTPSPPVSPKPITFSRVHPSNASVSSDAQKSFSTEPVKRLRTRASLPSISQGITNEAGAELERNTSLLKKMPPDGAPGLGSATTMAIYKPSLSPAETEFPHVDELGIRKHVEVLHAEDAGKTRMSTGLSPLPGKPLSHPTKDRAKKPRKVKDARFMNPEQERVPVAQYTQGESLSTPHLLEKVQETANVLYKANVSTKGSVNSSPKPSNTTHRWTEPSPISFSASPPPSDGIQKAMPLGRALPGTTSQPKSTEATVVPPLPKSPPPIPKVRGDDTNAQYGLRHVRIPSTGNRPTVMDVAFALSQHSELGVAGKITCVDEQPRVDVSPISSQPAVFPEAKAERRKSTRIDKYSSIMLPALKEEATPTPTPNGTLPKSTTPINIARSADSEESTVVHINHEGEPLPDVDVDQLLKPQSDSEQPNLHNQTISVDVLSINGLHATTIARDSNIFYDAELLAVIHRFKSKLDGLVSTTLWIWQGKQCQVGDQEQRKIQELARRYGTNAIMMRQHSESSQLVSLLGGVLATRQGSRSHWSPENTTMHLVRELGGVIYIDEHDLSVKNLCSAFSYCISILNTVYIWHGRGSTQAERQAALKYTQSFVPESQELMELWEGEDDTDDMFWMLLGGQDYAKADYWKWRKEALSTDPFVWRVCAERGDQTVASVSSLASEGNVHEGVYIINCIWEFFVLVGCHARGRRQDIRLALEVAKTMSKRSSPHRPFPPTVHVLVLPSQLPLDLRLSFRHFDEEYLNDGDVPDHMNILSFAEASEHLQKTSWDRTDLKDRRMLPLGVDLSLTLYD